MLDLKPLLKLNILRRRSVDVGLLRINSEIRNCERKLAGLSRRREEAEANVNMSEWRIKIFVYDNPLSLNHRREALQRRRVIFSNSWHGFSIQGYAPLRKWFKFISRNKFDKLPNEVWTPN